MGFLNNNSGQLTVAGIIIIYLVLIFITSLMPEISQEAKDVSTHANISGKPEAVLFDKSLCSLS